MTVVLSPRENARKSGAEFSRRDLFGLASLMLSYPDEAVCGLRDTVLRALEGCPHKTARRLAVFAEWWAAVEPGQLARLYVSWFDTRRRTCLHATYPVYRDSRERGAALSELKQIYRDAGFSPDESELPDYMPLILQFAALAPEAAVRVAVEATKDGFVAVAEALKKQDCYYAVLFDVIMELMEET